MSRFVVSVRLKPGSGDKVRELLAEGPPFDLGASPLERHLVFHGDDSLVLLFEGSHAQTVARGLLANSRVGAQLGRIAPYLEGKSAFPREVFSWERLQPAEGYSFGPLPGPGDSDGG